MEQKHDNPLTGDNPISEQPQSKMTRRQMLRGMAFTAAALVTAACAPAAAPPAPAATAAPAAPAPAVKQPKQGGKAVWAIATDPTSVAPFGILAGVAHDAKELMYDSLVAWDKNLKVVPALATEWSTPDEKTYVFKLRQGVKFHSGKEMDADDVKYSVELQGKSVDLPKPAAAIPQYPQIASVDVVDKYTVKLNMKGPDPTVMGWFAWSRWSSIIEKDWYAKIDNPNLKANGTGPFKLIEYVANDRVVMQRFPDHWKKGTPYLDELTLKILPDESARVAALRAGQLDGCDISGDAAKTLRNDPNITIIKGITSVPRVLQFTIKGEGKPWQDKRVRQAMSMAINRQEVIDKAYGGEAVLTGPIPPGYGEFSPPDDMVKKAYGKYDPDGAKKLLADAGFANGFEIVLTTLNPPPDYQAMAEIVKENLKKIGIEVKLNIKDLANFAKDYNEGTFEWLLNGRGMRHDPTGYVNEFGRPTVAQAKIWFNDSKGWKNDELSKLFEQVIVTLDQKARVPMIHKIQELFFDEVPHAYLCQPYKFTAVRTKVKDMYVSFTDFRPGLRDIWIDA